jgi:hypothetical protein
MKSVSLYYSLPIVLCCFCVSIISAEVSPPKPKPGGRDPLQASDLTFLGQQFVDLNYSNLAFTMRYVGGERRFLFYKFDPTQPNSVGDIIEYRLNPAGLANGKDHWVFGNVPEMIEVRRWHGWHTRQRMLDKNYPSATGVFAGNSAWPSSFHWDEATARLWYAWQPCYPGGQIVWAAYSAVTLDDKEAIVAGDAATSSHVVSDAHVHGPYYFRDHTEHDDFKQAACGFIPIAPERQAAMGGKYLAVGHHCANIGSKGPRGCSFWVVDDLPAKLPAEGGELWPGKASTLLYDTSPNTGAKPVPNVKLPNVQFQACSHASQGTIFPISSAGATPVHTSAPQPAGTAVDDAIYQHDYGSIDCITVYMATPAAGGAFVPEIWNGSAWVEPKNWALGAGKADLSADANVFWWPQVPFANIDIDGAGPIEGGSYVRLRRTQAGSSPGSIKAFITTTSLPTGNEYPDRPLGQGGHADLGSEQYDATHFAYAYEEFFWGGGWVRTDNVEGLAYFGPLRTGGQWYGAAPAYMQPIGGGKPAERTYMAAAESYSNGGKSEGPCYPYFFTFSSDKLLEMAAGKRDRNGHGLQPEAFTRMSEQWPGIIAYGVVNNPLSPYAGKPSFSVYGSGHTVVFDPATKQLIVWMSNASVYTGKPIVAFFSVR